VVACKQRPPLPHEVKHEDYPVLAAVSSCYPDHQGRLPTRYSPVRRSTQNRSPFLARLACVKHASSVQSEPGSNSPVKNCEGLTCVTSNLWSKSISPNSLFNCQRPWSLSQEREVTLVFSPSLVNDFLPLSFERSVRFVRNSFVPFRCGEVRFYSIRSPLSTTFCSRFQKTFRRFAPALSGFREARERF